MHLLNFKKRVQIQWLSIKPLLAIKQFGYVGYTTNVWLVLTLIANNLVVRKTLIETKLLATGLTLQQCTVCTSQEENLMRDHGAWKEEPIMWIFYERYDKYILVLLFVLIIIKFMK